MANWPTVRLPKEMMDEVERFASSEYAKKNGFTSKSQVIVAAVRDFLKRYSDYMSNFELVDITDERVKLRDHKMNQIVNVRISKKVGGAFCETEKLARCEHTEFVWLIPRFYNILKKFPTVQLKRSKN